MKQLIAIIMALSLSACSSDSSNGAIENEAIIGTWSFIYPSVQCTETYTFSTDNTFTLTSLDEAHSGTYAFTNESNSSNRHSLSFTVTNDNQQADCEGDNINDVGRVVDIFAEFVTTNQMNWYLQSSGGIPVVTVNKN